MILLSFSTFHFPPYTIYLLLAACLVLSILLIRERRRNTRKVNFMLDAVSSGDFAFKFREDGPSLHAVGVNKALNRIACIMREARAEAQEREKYYELVINQVNTGVLIVDDKGNIHQSNREALRLLGVEVLTHTRQLARIDDRLEKTIGDIRPGEKVRVSILNERGSVDLSIRVSAATLRGNDVRIVAISDINSEIADNQMESWNKLIRVLTHEIMNTVTPITSLSETLLGRLPASGMEKTGTADLTELRDGLTIIHTTSRDLLNFVQDYRRLTHIPTPQPRLFYVQAFAQRMRQMAIEQADGRAIDIAIQTTPSDLLVYADESLIAHVVTNLLKNAIQAITTSGEGSHIWIKAYTAEDDAVIIDIINDGPMIPQEVADHIFVPFFTTKPDGSGIGLSISRQIMKLSGGTLSLKSDARHRLTTFELLFP